MYNSKDMVSTVPGARKYYLSVRLDEVDLGKYLVLLQWYGLDPAQYEADNRSERFRELLDKFCEGLGDYGDIPEEYYDALITRPPLWKRRKEEELIAKSM